MSGGIGHALRGTIFRGRKAGHAAEMNVKLELSACPGGNPSDDWGDRMGDLRLGSIPAELLGRARPLRKGLPASLLQRFLGHPLRLPYGKTGLVVLIIDSATFSIISRSALSTFCSTSSSGPLGQ